MRRLKYLAEIQHYYAVTIKKRSLTVLLSHVKILKLCWLDRAYKKRVRIHW